MKETLGGCSTAQELSTYIVALLRAKNIPIINPSDASIQIDIVDASDIYSKKAQREARFGVMEMYSKDQSYFGICNSVILDSPPKKYRRTSDWPHIGNEERDGIALGIAWEKWLLNIECVLELAQCNDKINPYKNYQSVVLHIVTNDCSEENKQQLLARWGLNFHLCADNSIKRVIDAITAAC